jgi:predicted nucleic acid-binding protein
VRITFDSSVLFYAVDRDAGERHVIARDLVDRAMAADCVLTLQSLAEFFSSVTRKSKRTVADAAGFVADWRTVFTIHAADEECLAGAIDASRRKMLSFWDALLWATARQAGCRLLLSEDMHDGQTLGGVTIVNPFAPKNTVLLAAVLP